MLLLMPSSWLMSSFARAKDCRLLFFFFFLPARCPFLFLGAAADALVGGAGEDTLKLVPGFGAAMMGWLGFGGLWEDEDGQLQAVG